MDPVLATYLLVPEPLGRAVLAQSCVCGNRVKITVCQVRVVESTAGERNEENILLPSNLFLPGSPSVVTWPKYPTAGILI